MYKSIGILDNDYTLWVNELVKRYRSSQIKAAIKVNKELIRYYWELGKDIEEKQADNKYGSKFYATLSRDLRHEMPDVDGLSETSIRYAKRFYALYSRQIENLPQLVERFYSDLFSVPWVHHRYIIDKALTNFRSTLPDVGGDLAQELIRDSYDFSFTGVRGKYNERILKDALLNNITNCLLELGIRFAYVVKSIV